MLSAALAASAEVDEGAEFCCESDTQPCKKIRVAKAIMATNPRDQIHRLYISKAIGSSGTCARQIRWRIFAKKGNIKRSLGFYTRNLGARTGGGPSGKAARRAGRRSNLKQSKSPSGATQVQGHKMSLKIRLGISECLLGKPVRFDGGHKLDRFLTETLGRYVEYVPVCPEVECGMPVPRESMHLEGDPSSPRLITIRTRVDKTDQMVHWAEKRVAALEKEGLMGFIFKSDSPSSGMERVKVYNEKGMSARKGSGIFARIFMEQFPLLPVEEEGRLHDPAIRENFIERVFALARWREFLANKGNRGGLVDFHTKHKFLILSHSDNRYREMGRLIAGAKQIPLGELCEKYQKSLMEALKIRATAKKNTNV
ncbi:MAG: hypothetical protein H6Q04_1950, partial [Acidobacteria bacterium]|nr:hypothetical protein [Acidobacteriota bacterium]